MRILPMITILSAGIGLLGSLGLVPLYRSIQSASGRARKVWIGVTALVALLVLLSYSVAGLTLFLR